MQNLRVAYYYDKNYYKKINSRYLYIHCSDVGKVRKQSIEGNILEPRPFILGFGNISYHINEIIVFLSNYGLEFLFQL